MIIAKPVIDKKFWILQKNNEKVGNVEATDTGYQVRINNQVEQYKTIKMVEQRVNVQFESFKRVKAKPVTNIVYKYEAKGKAYNPTWDAQHKLPLYTKTRASKSYHAAGWYWLKQFSEWEVVQDPKFILLQRYPYKGPFHNQQEAITNE